MPEHNSNTIAAFDFDGTVTTNDTLWAFMAFASGRAALMKAVACEFWKLTAAKLGLIDSAIAKEALFRRLYAGVPADQFSAWCEAFAGQESSRVRREALAAIRRHRSEGHRVVIVTASPTAWVRPIAKTLGFAAEDVIGTEIEIDSGGRLTGGFATPNCRGKEKIVRLLKKFPLRSDYTLYAYGDSSGDRELLAAADFAFYRKF